MHSQQRLEAGEVSEPEEVQEEEKKLRNSKEYDFMEGDSDEVGRSKKRKKKK